MSALATQAEAYARRYYVLGVLSLICFFNYMDRYVIRVLMEPIKLELKLTDTEIGLLVGFGFALVYAAFGIPLARLADKSSRIRLISACIVVWSVMTALSGAARSFVHMLLARGGIALGEAGCIPAAHSLIVDHFPPERRAFAISLFQAVGIVGAIVGAVLGGLLAEAYGWRWTFVILGVPGVFVGLLAFLTIREPERSHQRGNGAAGPKIDDTLLSALAKLLRRRGYVHVVIAIALENFVSLGIGAWVLTFFMRVHDMSVAQVGLWLGGLAGIGGVVGTLVGAVACAKLISRDRRWEVWLPAAAAAMALPLYLVTFLSPLAAVALGAAFATNFVTQLGNGAGLASVQSLAPPESRALAVSLLLFSNAIIGLGAGPLVVGMMSDWLAPTTGDYSLRYAFLVVLVVSAWSIAHFVLAGRSFREDARSNELETQPA